jgi:hypothetical protein
MNDELAKATGYKKARMSRGPKTPPNALVNGTEDFYCPWCGRLNSDYIRLSDNKPCPHRGLTR